MRLLFWIPTSCVFAVLLSSCGTTRKGGTQIAGTGPFDRNGRYIEEWADNPAKWRKGAGAPSPHELKTDEVPVIAKNEQPPQNANPLPPSSSSIKTSSKPVPVITETPVATKSRKTVSESQPVASKSRTKVTESEPEVVKSKPKSKPVAKAKPKPKSTRYLVKSGDSLSAIASRNGTSVSAIKSANGISGTLIRPGQSLVIPKR